MAGPHALPLWSWASYSTPQSLSFPTYTVRRIAEPSVRSGMQSLSSRVWGGHRPCTPSHLPPTGVSEHSLLSGPLCAGLQLHTGQGHSQHLMLSTTCIFTDPHLLPHNPGTSCLCFAGPCNLPVRVWRMQAGQAMGPEWTQVLSEWRCPHYPGNADIYCKQLCFPPPRPTPSAEYPWNCSTGRKKTQRDRPHLQPSGGPQSHHFSQKGENKPA